MTSRTIYGLRQQVKEAVRDRAIHAGGEDRQRRHGRGLASAAPHADPSRGGEAGHRPRSSAPSDGRDPELRLRRFEREARATAGLKSPHTVQLYDFGVTDDGTLYYVMELLDGMDLDTLVERFGPVPPERAIHLLLQVCASLDDAHQNGLVHRDIKPANIFVSRVGAAWDFVKVLDFGLVKLDGARQSHEDAAPHHRQQRERHSGVHRAGGRARHAKTDHRVDIYALGCVAYWLVTGKLVFEGPGAIKVMSDHVHTPPPPPSSRSEAPIPPELDALILECLEKEPEQRPASASALQARLQAIPSPRLGRASAPSTGGASTRPRAVNAPSPTSCSPRRRARRA